MKEKKTNSSKSGTANLKNEHSQNLQCQLQDKHLMRKKVFKSHNIFFH
jgi:hypothetical protein